MYSKAFPFCLAFLLAIWVQACSDDNDGHEHDGHVEHGDGGHDLDEEGCEHLTKGPFVDVTVGADAVSAGEVKSDHKAYRASLTAGQEGFLKYAAAAAGDLVVFLDQELGFEVQDDQGKALTIESSEKSVDACTEVKGKHTVELPAVGTYYLKLGPAASASQVTLVLELAGHAH
jgi:hypothetical protein